MEAKVAKQNKSLSRRIFSAETFIFCMGIGSIVYGLINGFKVMQIFFGICILGGSVMLHFVRKKDWDAHWAELDRVRQAHELRMKEESEQDRKR